MSAVVRAQPKQRSLPEEQVYLDAMSWFRKLVVAANALADFIDRQRFVSFSFGWINSLQSMVQFKRGIAYEIRSADDEGVTNLQPRLKLLADQLNLKVQDSIMRMNQVAGLIVQYEAEGQHLSSDLSQIFLTRQNWIGVLLRELAPSSEIRQVAQDVEDSAKTLETVLDKLKELIQTVQL